MLGKKHTQRGSSLNAMVFPTSALDNVTIHGSSGNKAVTSFCPNRIQPPSDQIPVSSSRSDHTSGTSFAPKSVVAPTFRVDAEALVQEQENVTVKVVARFKPLALGTSGFQVVEDHSVVPLQTNKSPAEIFRFDHVFAPESTQEEVYQVLAADMVDDCLRGYNATLFAYGQTGAGKTHTMFGPALGGGSAQTTVPSGVIPQAMNQVFEGLQRQEHVQASVTMALLEVYQEEIQDLLRPSDQKLRLRERGGAGVVVEGLHWAPVHSPQDALALVAAGEQQRHVAHTGMNDSSSRSHSVLILQVTRRLRDGTISRTKLNFADLAGSERAGRTARAGGGRWMTQIEARQINHSLSALGNCILALTSLGRKHVPFRDSVLTFLLRDSLGGNSKTRLVLACSNAVDDIEETLSTLRFGARAKKMTNAVSVNAVLTRSELERRLAVAEQVVQQLRGSSAETKFDTVNEVARLRVENARLSELLREQQALLQRTPTVCANCRTPLDREANSKATQPSAPQAQAPRLVAATSNPAPPPLTSSNPAPPPLTSANPAPSPQPSHTPRSHPQSPPPPSPFEKAVVRARKLSGSGSSVSLVPATDGDSDGLGASGRPTHPPLTPELDLPPQHHTPAPPPAPPPAPGVATPTPTPPPAAPAPAPAPARVRSPAIVPAPPPPLGARGPAPASPAPADGTTPPLARRLPPALQPACAPPPPRAAEEDANSAPPDSRVAPHHRKTEPSPSAPDPRVAPPDRKAEPSPSAPPDSRVAPPHRKAEPSPLLPLASPRSNKTTALRAISQWLSTDVDLDDDLDSDDIDFDDDAPDALVQAQHLQRPAVPHLLPYMPSPKSSPRSLPPALAKALSALSSPPKGRGRGGGVAPQRPSQPQRQSQPVRRAPPVGSPRSLSEWLTS